MDFTLEKFNEIKHKAADFYNSIGNIYSPYFKETIAFNMKGWEHIVFKGWNRARSLEDQFSRFRHLKLAPAIIGNSKTLQGILKTQKFERVKKKNGSWQKILKLITYYEFIAVMESHGSRVRVKIIVKQIEDGQKFFLSIIPFWGVNKDTGERMLYNGDLETD